MFRPVSTPKEIADVAALARDIWTRHYTPIIGPAQVAYMLGRFQSEAAIADQIQTGMVYALMEGDAGPAGYLAYEPRGDILFLSKLYVRESARGKGWARRALDWIIRREKPERIELTVNRHNTIAIAAYRCLGFRVERNVVADIGGGFVMDDHLMVLNLGR